MLASSAYSLMSSTSSIGLSSTRELHLDPPDIVGHVPLVDWNTESARGSWPKVVGSSKLRLICSIVMVVD